MLNKAILIGHVGDEPEFIETSHGELARFSLATSTRWKDKETGEKKDKTEWHRIVVFNKHLVDVVKRFVRKGSKLYIEGMITTRKWQDKDTGDDRYSSEIALKFNGQLVLCDRKESDHNEPPADSYEGD